MKKISIYAVIIILIGLSFIAWDFYEMNDRIFNDHHYMKSSFDYVNAEKNDICIIKNAIDKLSYFKVEGMTSDHRLCIRFGNKPALIPVDELEKIVFSSNGVQINQSQRWVSDIFNDQNAWDDVLSVISQDDIERIKLNNKVYYYNRLLRIGKLPDPNLLIPLNFGILLGIYILVYFVLYANRLLFKRFNIVIYLSIIATSIFVAWIFSGQHFDTLFNIFLSKNLITFFLLFWVIKLVNEKTKVYDFGKKEFFKFVVIAVFGLLSEYFGGIIFNYLYFKVFEFTGGNVYEFTNVLGWFKFWIYFALANFMSNLTTYILDLRKTEKSVQLQKTNESAALSSLASIQSRINPHFLFNALNSIASLAHTEPKKTEEMAIELARFYSQCTDKKSELLVSLADELEILKSYLLIERIRFGDRLEVSIPTNIDVMDIMIPSFTLQPIVENAIKYGYNYQDDYIRIRITASLDSRVLTLSIYDSGPPFSENMQSGYGLTSIYKKLKVLFPERHNISYINEPEKCVEIVIKT